MEEEMRLHLELRSESLRDATTIAKAAAERSAARQFGNRTLLREQAHEIWGFPVAEQILRDTGFALRLMRKNSAFTIAAVLSLGLGIGVNTAVFTLLNALIFRPLPVKNPGELVRIGSHENNGMAIPLPGPVLDDLRHEPLLTGICGFLAGTTPVEIDKSSVMLSTLVLTGDCYRTLGVRAALGRLIEPSDDRAEAARVAVLGYAFWQSRFARDPNILGKEIQISGKAFEVIGVTEPRFHGLLWGQLASVTTSISQTTTASPHDPTENFYWAETLARLQPGASPERLRARLATNWRRLLDHALPPGFAGRTEQSW